MARLGTEPTRRFRLQVENTLPCVRDDLISLNRPHVLSWLCSERAHSRHGGTPGLSLRFDLGHSRSPLRSRASISTTFGRVSDSGKVGNSIQRQRRHGG